MGQGEVATDRNHRLGGTEIRLIRLKPVRSDGAQSTPATLIECYIETVELSQEPTYSAISYAWGRGDYDQEIYINGKAQYITQNLAEALRHIRHETEETVVWVDQLSINQDDNIERSQQVQLMRQIYENALTVIVWLGTATDHSNLTMVTLEELATYSEVTRGDTGRVVSGIAKRMSRLKGTHWSDQDIISNLPAAFDEFCNRSYWKRLWVIQEFAVATELVIKCGAFNLPSSVFLAAWDNVLELSSKTVFQTSRLGKALTSPASSFAKGIVTSRSFYHETAQRLFGKMNTNLALEEDYNHPQCSDPRDRVFSLLGLANDRDEFSQFPDYTMTTEQVYTELAWTHLRNGVFNILDFCQFPRNLESLPSWVPDWSMQIRTPIGQNTTYPRRPQASCDANGGKACLLGKSRLVLVGGHLDTVASTGPTWSPNWLEPLKAEDAIAYFEGIEAFCRESELISRDEIKVACARIAIADPGGEPDDFFDDLIAHYEAALMCFKNGIPLPSYFDEESDGQLTGELAMASRYAVELKRLHSRRVIITDMGYVGLAPTHVVAGDCIQFFLGGIRPHAIRQKANDLWSLVGASYIYQHMQGEFFETVPELEPIVLE